MKVLAVLGGQWGDEGKGKLVDLLSNRFDIVARYHGGHNAGHTVKFGNQHFALHLLPRGSRPRPDRRHRARRRRGPRGAAVGDGRAAGGRYRDRREPASLRPRARHSSLPSPSRRRPRDAPPATPRSARRCAGSGPRTSPSRPAGRSGSRSSIARDPRRPGAGDGRGDGGAPARLSGSRTCRAADAVLRMLGPAAERLRAHVTDTGRYLRNHLKAGATLLARRSPRRDAGPLRGDVSLRHLLALHVGRRRVGPRDRAARARGEHARAQGLHDASRARALSPPSSTRRPASSSASAATSTARRPAGPAAPAGSTRSSRARPSSSRARRPSPSPSSTVSTSSKRSRSASATASTANRSRTCLPLAEDIARLEPEYEKLPGWKSTTTGVTRYEELPAAAQRYVRALEDAIGAPAVFVSTGPRREETIWRPDTPFLNGLPPAK